MAGLCTRADIPAWDSITDGTTLYSGGYVTHNGHYWRCQKRHVKTAHTAPGILNPLWLDAPLIEQYATKRRAALNKIRARKRLFLMEEITMRKILVIMLAFTLAFALTSTAYAATIPAGAITITAQPVDYVSALAGIAKPTTAAHNENERVAVLVTVAVPQWYDVANMSVAVEQHGLVLDSTAGLAVASGNYLLYGTLYSTTGRLTITMQDNALTGAATAQALWAALYGDRTVSASVSFAAPIPASIPTTQVLEIPQTGDAPTMIAVPLCAAAVCIGVLLYKKRSEQK